MPYLLSSLSLGGTKGSLTLVTNAGEGGRESAQKESVCVVVCVWWGGLERKR